MLNLRDSGYHMAALLYQCYVLPGPALPLVGSNSICRCVHYTDVFHNSVHICKHSPRLQGVHMPHAAWQQYAPTVYAQFVHQRLGTRVENYLVYTGPGNLLSGGFIFDRGIAGVLSARLHLLYFLMETAVYMGVCVYTHTHTDTARRVLRCEPRGRDETPGPGGPKESISSISA